MNPLDRVMRYARAYTGLGKLNRLTASMADRPADLISESFSYSDAFLQPIQVPEELARLLEDVRTLNPRTVLEIGTSMGGTLYLWTRLAQPDGTIVSVDLPGGKFGGGYSPLRTPIYRRFGRLEQKLHLMRANSHEAATLQEVKGLFGGTEIDFLFIDGDHTYEGVKQDWEMYSPLVRQGGLIVFHDVAGNYEETQVKRFWDSIKTGYPHREYMFHPRGHYGIGVLFK
jgi:predicted O-methyltransferase YrrM